MTREASLCSHRLRTILSIAAVMGAMLGVTVVANATPDPITAPQSDRPVKNCDAFKQRNDASESQELFDGATGKLVITTEDSIFVLDEASTPCKDNPLTKRRLEHARRIEDENVAALCKSFRQAIAEKRTQEKGRPVNLAAAEKYVAETCN